MSTRKHQPGEGNRVKRITKRRNHLPTEEQEEVTHVERSKDVPEKVLERAFVGESLLIFYCRWDIGWVRH